VLYGMKEPEGVAHHRLTVIILSVLQTVHRPSGLPSFPMIWLWTRIPLPYILSWKSFLQVHSANTIFTSLHLGHIQQLVVVGCLLGHEVVHGILAYGFIRPRQLDFAAPLDYLVGKGGQELVYQDLSPGGRVTCDLSPP